MCRVVRFRLFRVVVTGLAFFWEKLGIRKLLVFNRARVVLLSFSEIIWSFV